VVGFFRKLSPEELGKPDIHCTLAPNGRTFWIEIKFGKDTISDDQKRFHKYAEECGALVYVCRDYQEFIKYYQEVVQPSLFKP
jgi:hypothetical protein